MVDSPPEPPSSLRRWLTDQVARQLQLAPEQIKPNLRLRDQGLDSAHALALLTKLEARIGRRLPKTTPWRHPTINALVTYIEGGPTQAAQDAEVRASSDEAIAIVGIGCRFPGATTPEEFWRLLCEGVDAVSPVPADRWDAEQWFDSDPSAEGKANTRWGGFLDQVDHFDPAFFGISPREAREMDPQQRLFLEAAWEALERGGVVPDSLVDSQTAVFAGAMWNDWDRIVGDDPARVRQHSATGHDTGIIAGRLSYLLGARGPSLTVNTACSSSLVAVHLAVQSLQRGESNFALAGAVNLMLSPLSSVAMSKFGAMAPDGRCKAFDARANGYVRGEGVGVVALEPLSRALERGAPIYALIRGTAINNDGYSNGLTAPSGEAQEAVLSRAWGIAGISTGEVGFVEAHGPGTYLGDPIEAEALGSVFSRGREGEPLVIGSVKTNLGHLEAASGIAGLIKTTLALHNGQIPPNLHFEQPNPHIDFEQLRLRVPTELQEWPTHEGPRLAGVSSFGFGGTNAHVALSSAPGSKRREGFVPRTSESSFGRRAEQLVFVFPGQGGQWVGMGQGLLHREPEFRRAVTECDAALRPVLGWSVLERLATDQELESPAIIQPLIFTVQVALSRTLAAYGVRPNVVLGQSMGEVAAAHIGGHLGLDDAARVIGTRAALATERLAGAGAMAVVELPAAELELELPAGLSIAGVSSPLRTLIAGEPEQIDELARTWEQRGVRCTRVRVTYASHSAHVDPILDELGSALSELEPKVGAIPWWSTTNNAWAKPRSANASYWVKNLRAPFNLVAGIRKLHNPSTIFIEIGPHPLLVRALRETAVAADASLPTLHREQDEHADLHALLERLDALGLVQSGETHHQAIVPLTARTPEALDSALASLREFARTTPRLDVRDLAWTLFEHRAHHEHRATVVVENRDQLIASLGPEPSEHPPIHRGRTTDPGKVAFVFPGQGGQWVGMARRLLMHSAVFGETFDACDDALKPETGWSAHEVLLGFPRAPSLERIEVVQPLLWAVMVSLAALWRSWGIEPDMVIGHSQGEIAAACVSGALGVGDGARIVARRSRLLRRIAGQGAMAAIGLGIDELMEQLPDELSLAVVNSRESSVVAGAPSAIDEWVAALDARGVFARRVDVDIASHSPQIDVLRGFLRFEFREIAPTPGHLPFISTVFDQEFDGEELDGAYWIENLRRPVRFDRAIERAIASGARTFIEVSPHPLLTGVIERALAAHDQAGTVVGSLRRDQHDNHALLDSLARLFVTGVPFATRALLEARRIVALPTSPFERQRFWPPPPAGSRTKGPRPTANGGWTLAFELDLRHQPWLGDHRVHGEIVVPGIAMVVWMHRALAALPGSWSVVGAVMESPLTFDGRTRDVQISAVREAEGEGFVLELHVAKDDSWIRHARARAEPIVEFPDGEMPEFDDFNAEPPPYEEWRMAGNQYGPAFQGIERFAGAGDTLIAELALPADVEPDQERSVHPALLDAALQLMLIDSPFGQANALFSVGLRLFRPHARRLRALVVRPDGPLSGSVILWDRSDGGLVAQLDDVALLPVDRADLELGNPVEALRMIWRPEPFEMIATRERCVLVTDTLTPLAERLREQLREAGSAVELVRTADLPRVLQGGSGAHVIALWRRPEGPADAAAIALTQAAVEQIQALIDTGSTSTWVTEGANTFAQHPEASLGQPALAALWGLGRVVQREHPELRHRLIDVADPSAHALLADAILVEDYEDQVALVGGERHVRRLVHGRDLPDSSAPVGQVLITGGTGFVGRQLARWLIEEGGAEHVVLVGRNPPTAAALEQVEDLGDALRFDRCDVTDRDALAELLDGLPEVDTVIHGAMALHDSALSQLSADQVAEVMAPKVRGAMLLHELCRERELNRFVLLSSMASVLGNPGQGAYAAANAFLDGLAEQRQALGLAAQSQSWGIWANQSQRLKHQDRERFRRSGVRPLDVAEGLKWFASAWRLDAPHLVLVPADWDQFAHALPSTPLVLEELVSNFTLAPSLSRRGEVIEDIPSLERAVMTELLDILGLPEPDSFDHKLGFSAQGLDSLMAISLKTRLEQRLHVQLSATVAFNYPTFPRLIRHLAELKDLATRDQTKEREIAASDHAAIAVVGMGCRLPGADTPAQLWALLLAGTDALAPIPNDRFDIDAWYDPDPSAPGRTYQREAGLVDEVDAFDHGYFGVSPREAQTMDPQQGMLLEVGISALEDAGISVTELDEASAGVFVGALNYDHGARLLGRAEADWIDGFVASGTRSSVLSGRLSHFLGVHGPSLTVDTACSSSLTAIHLAVRSLRAGECELAIAGGVNALLSPLTLVERSKNRMLSPTGRCRPFDASADGIAIGEGCGLVVLKRLSDAMLAGDRIRAVIRGSALNHDGRTSGLTVPNGLAQRALLRAAIKESGVKPEEIAYVEAHGTGTSLGDPIELEALSKAMRLADDSPLWIGSLKANLGHLESASGVAGFIKAVLALEHQVIPPQIHFETGNPMVPWDESALRVPTQATELDTRYAGVSSFGFSGTNVHVVLERGLSASEHPPSTVPSLVLLSARSPEALSMLRERWLERLEGFPPLADLCYTAAHRRGRQAWTLAAAGRDAAELRERLERAKPIAQSRRPPPVVFVFDGQGGAHLGMGRDLLEASPEARQVIEDIDALVQSFGGTSVLDALQTNDLDATELAQPAIFALEVGVVTWLASRGVRPDAVVGHSVGELAAAWACGALSLFEACGLLVNRASVMADLRGSGAMLALAIAPEEVEALGDDAISLAVINSPSSCVIAGPYLVLARIRAEFASSGRFARWVSTDYAFHSPAVVHAGQRLRELVGSIDASTPSVPFYSSVYGVLREDPLDLDYWVANLCQPVQFADAIAAVTMDMDAVFVELGPHPALQIPIAEVLTECGRDYESARAAVIPTLTRSGHSGPELAEAAGRLHALGVELDLDALVPAANVVSLPSYPWQRRRHRVPELATPRPAVRGERIVAPNGWTELVRLDQPRPTWEARPQAGQAPDAGALIRLLIGLIDVPLLDALMAAGVDRVERVHVTRSRTGVEVWANDGHDWRELLNANLGSPAPLEPWAKSLDTKPCAQADLEAELGVDLPPGVVSIERGAASWRLGLDGQASTTAFVLARVLASSIHGGARVLGGWGRLQARPQLEPVGGLVVTPTTLVMFDSAGIEQLIVEAAQWDPDPADHLEVGPGLALVHFHGDSDPSVSAPDPGNSLRAQLERLARTERHGLLSDWLESQARAALLIDEPLPHDVGLFGLGMDSVLAIGLLAELSTALAASLPNTLIFEHPSIEALATAALAALNFEARHSSDHLRANVDERVQDPRPVQGRARSALALEPEPSPSLAEHRPPAGALRLDEPIAIVGLACRLPHARSPEAFWQLLEAGVDAVTTVPSERWDASDWTHEDPDHPGSMVSAAGAFLDDIASFDPAFFGISPREAERMDPQQRLLLEVSYEALEHAGWPSSRLRGSRTGVFIGIGTEDFAQLKLHGGAAEDISAYDFTGTDISVAAGRISHTWGLEGPSMAIDTACSSSMVALHLASQSLRLGESDRAIVGGVNVMLAPELGVFLSRARAMSPSGRCRTFDAAADGYVRGEGCVVLALRRLSDAERAGDRIIALIRGSAVRHDGHASGLTVPSPSSQVAVIREALAHGRVDPAEVSLIEAHGTGTPLGDPIEVRALTEVFGGRAERLWLASHKTNLGHLEAASGITGVLKVILAMTKRVVPPHLNLETLNPDIELGPLRAQIPRDASEWNPRGGRRLAGVSSFGISGTNAHVVLEQGPAAQRAEDRLAHPTGPWLLPLSARSAASLVSRARALADRVEAASGSELDDIGLTLGDHRDHHKLRAAVVGPLDELPTLLREIEASQVPRRSRLVFVFAGQGSQRLGMVRELYASQAEFTAALDSINLAFEPTLGWSLIDELHADEADSRLDRVEVVQPLLCAIQIALAQTLIAWGLRPDGVIGHSMGEVAAAVVAGGLGPADGGRVIGLRSRLVAERAPQGGMAVAELSRAEAEAALADHPQLSIAAVNGPQTTLLAGDADALDAFGQTLEARGRFFRRVVVDYASHSPGMDELIEPLTKVLAGLEPQTPAVPIHSTVRARPIEGPELDPAYWGDNLREPVRFDSVVLDLLSRGPVTFVEIGPHPLLGYGIKQWIESEGEDSVCLASLRHDLDDRRGLLELAGRLYERGHVPDFRALYPDGQLAELPSYAWDRARHWPALRRPRQTQDSWVVGEAGSEGGRLLSVRLGDAEWLGDHRVGGLAIVPGAAYVVWALRALGRQAGPASVRGLEIEGALTFSEGDEIEVQVVCHPVEPGVWDAEILAARTGGSWTRHARARVCLGQDNDADQPRPVDLDELRTRCVVPREGSDLYRQLADAGLDYGPAFRGLVELRVGDREALAELRKTPAATAGLHPAWLDAAQHAVAPLLPAGRWLPARVERFETFAPIPDSSRVHARLRALDERRATTDIHVYTEAGEPLAQLLGLQLDRIEAQVKTGTELRLFEDRWEALAKTPGPGRASELPWLIYGGDKDLAETIVETLREHGVAGIEWLQTLDQLDAATLDGVQVVYLASDRHEASWRPLRAIARRQAAPAQVCVVTRGAWSLEQDAHVVPDARAIWGLGRTLRHEHPAWDVSLIDLEADECPSASVEAMIDYLRQPDAERELAIRHGQRFGARWSPLPLPPPVPRRSAPASGDRPFRLMALEPGNLDNLELLELERSAPGPDQIELTIEAAGVSFSDVLKAHGLYPGIEGPPPLGVECSGRIARLGSNVRGWAIGDPVIAILEGGGFGSHALTRANLVARRPKDISAAGAATIPGAFLTAFHAIVTLAKISSNDRILIHSASGGVGQAAIQIALDAGAKVYGTAGTATKRALLLDLGCEAAWNSRSHEWYEGIRSATGGEGVDIVLNTLPGEDLRLGIELLRSGGRFVEIGRTDIYANRRLGLEVFRKNVAFFAVDIGEPALLASPALGQGLRELASRIESGRYHPLPFRTWPISRGAEALREMSRGRHTGKLVLEVSGPEASEDRVLLPIPGSAELGLPGGTWLITGGTGGLGLCCAELLAGAGAGRLVLIARTGPSPEVERRIDTMRSTGTQVEFSACDVSDRSALAGLVREFGSDLDGVLHCAGVLDDALLRDLDEHRFARTLAAKVKGARHLHELTRSLPLEHFVLFSSLSACLGSPSQSAYALANAYLDGLAGERRALGLPALSIAWGAWAQVGLAAGDERRGARLARRGLPSLSPDTGTEVLARLLASNSIPASISATPIDWAAYREAQPEMARTPRFVALESETAPSAAAPASEGIHELLRDARGPRERARKMEAWVLERAARVLGVAIGQIARTQPLAELGLDSLMSLELRNQLQSLVEAKLPSTLLFSYPTIAALAAHLLDEHLPVDLPPTESPELAQPSDEARATAANDDDTPLESPVDETGKPDQTSDDPLLELALTAALADTAIDAPTDHAPLDAASDDEVMAALLRELSKPM